MFLPTGALLEAIELNYCDTGAGGISFNLFRQAKNGAPAVTPIHSSSGTPGCVVVMATLAPPITIDNDANSYNLEIAFGAADNTVQFASARAAFKLQVAPAPATSAFTDVPVGHPIFRFVAALAAAGVTGGCGPTAFCPDAPLTRGQMAVFLATALGLHFQN